jgi:hypothetical protein
VLEDDMLIFREPVRGGSSYTRLQLVPAELYNIMFVAFHSKRLADISIPTVHYTVFVYNNTDPVCTLTLSACAMPVQVALM